MRNVTPPLERSCPSCGRSFVSDHRRIWCSDACRQRGFRLRRQPPDEALLLSPRRLPKDAIVYQCPTVRHEAPLNRVG